MKETSDQKFTNNYEHFFSMKMDTTLTKKLEAEARRTASSKAAVIRRLIADMEAEL